jgi:hypothetical protein
MTVAVSIRGVHKHFGSLHALNECRQVDPD